ncbi:MAG: hypothetical protein A3K65_03060 [Euryarchaeota archaeon RBG_16_68_12]|nr:MAG: hypothetical protein A3K65_03060 [Euryarchaeota archaeon RBG_16_68_12]
MDVVELRGCRLHLMPVVRGLASESETVRAAVAEVAPEAVALSISREEIEALRAHDGADVPPDNVDEEVYVRGLSRFGAVRKPPPCFVEALAAAAARGIPVHPLDMDEDQYTSAFVAAVGTVDVLRTNARQGRLQRWTPRSETPEAFVREWDALVNTPAGYRRLQEEREAFIARRLRQLAGRYRTLLALVEVERAGGVRGRLSG